MNIIKIRFTVIFIFTKNTNKKNTSAVENETECVVGGCSNQLCLEPNSPQKISTCEWQDVYSCYQKAECKRQETGYCGFTLTPELENCLEENGKPLKNINK